VIHVICGLMGSGKSTYARKHYKYIVEFEDFGRKDKQLQKAKALHDKGKKVAYITCYPTTTEMEYFKSLPDSSVRWLLIDTDLKQCRRNIIRRGRKSDVDVLKTRFEKNHKLLSLIARTSISFERIRVFETEEKW